MNALLNVGHPDLRCSLYTNSISVALQALTVISMGDVADHRECGSVWTTFVMLRKDITQHVTGSDFY